MRQLFPRLDPTEQGRVIQKLQELKIPYEQDSDGSINVPGHMVAEARARLAQDGIPTTIALGNSRLDRSSITESASLQEEKFRIALEEELQKTLVLLAPISAAKVHIAPGNNSPFIGDDRDPSASVVVQLRAGFSPARSVADAVVTTLGGAVEGLMPENIFVSDSSGAVIWDGKADGDGGVNSGVKKRQAERVEAQLLERRIESAIGRVFGPGKASVSAEVEMNFDKEDVTTTTKTPSKVPIRSDTVTEEMSDGTGIQPRGAVPPLGGAPAASGGTASSASGNTYSVSQAYTEFGDGTLERVDKSKAPGAVTSSRVSIFLDESLSDHVQNVQTYVSTLIGADADPEKFIVTVSAVAFDTSAADMAKKELAAVNSSQMKQQIISLIPVFALVIVGFLVVRALGKAAAGNTNVMVSAGALPSGGGAVATLPAPAGSATSAKAAGAAAALPGPGDEEALSDTARKRADAIKRSMRPDVEDIPEKFDAELEQLLRMADTRPESVGLLIKSWLLEETL